MKSSLVRRKIQVDLTCPSCGQEEENIEHLFFKCKEAQLIWRASRLGFDFQVGTPISFLHWWIKWLQEAPDRDSMLLVIAILWVIWCNRNQALFHNKRHSVEESLSRVSQILKELEVISRYANYGHGDQSEITFDSNLHRSQMGTQGV